MFFFSVRPLLVEILSSNNPFSADRLYEIPCQTYGSRPPAKIMWFIENKELLASKYNYSQVVSSGCSNKNQLFMFL